MLLTTEFCEACKYNLIKVEEVSDDPYQPYRLCQRCYERLLNRSLRPFEWYNLAVIHSPKKFLLHDDFYEENGEATQPEVEVIVTNEDIAPTLQDVRNDLEALLDFSITRWFLDEDIVITLKAHDKQTIIRSVKSRFYSVENHEIKSRMLEVVADVLGNSASEWVRELWCNYDEELLVELSWATSSSLPIEEGLNKVLEKLSLISEKDLPIYAFTCLYRFRSRDVLDWIELNSTVFNDNWGRLAALCFPTWERMKLWLNKGRPLSLIALDTMANCFIRGGDPLVERFRPAILETDKNEVEKVLNKYYQKDTVPRVRMKIARILDNKNKIFE